MMRRFVRFPYRPFRRAAVAAAVATLLAPVQAADVLWIGGESFWDIAENWAPGLPEVGDNVLLGSFNTTFRAGAVEVNSFVGTGRLSLIDGSMSIASASSIGALDMSGGRFSGEGALSVSGAGNWSGGEMIGSGSTTFNGALALSGDGDRSIDSRTVNFQGTTTWTNAPGPGAGSFITRGGTINNAGTWRDETSTDTGFFQSGFFGAPATINNTGTYVKTGNTHTDLSTMDVTNTGTIDIQAGVLALPDTFANDGTVMGTGTVTSADFTNRGRVAPGSATAPGLLTLTGSFAQTAAGRFAIELEKLGSSDSLLVSGAATLAGTLELICFADCSFAFGQTFTILDAAADSLTGTFASVVYTGFAPGSFTLTYDLAKGDVILNAVPVPEPGTYAMFTAGLGALLWLGRQRRQHSRTTAVSR